METDVFRPRKASGKSTTRKPGAPPRQTTVTNTVRILQHYKTAGSRRYFGPLNSERKQKKKIDNRLQLHEASINHA